MKTLTEVSIKNFLSFRNQTVRLSDLSVLVGPNGAGKTNFLKVFQFVAEVAKSDLTPAIRAFGGMERIRFRSEDREKSCTISIKGMITEFSSPSALDEYSLTFRDGSRINRADIFTRREQIRFKRTKGSGRRITVEGGKISVADTNEGEKRRPPPSSTSNVQVQTSSAGLSLIRRLGEDYGASQVNAIASTFEDLRLFDIDVSRARLPTAMHGKQRLLADASNLASHLLFLHDEFPDIFAKLCDDVRYVLPSFRDFRFVEVGGSDRALTIEIKEERLADYTPMARASFGTIRAVALFAMLHNPQPPRLTCLEEVDHGLHPHALDRLVERLRDASRHAQFIIATHSPALVNRLHPPELILFERSENTNETVIVDITSEQISQMQDESELSLGELWFSGSLGGTL